MAFNRLDDVLRLLEPHFPAAPRQYAIGKAVEFVVERLNGEDGLGGIYPAMANAVMMFDCLGHAKDDPTMATAKAAIRKLLVREPGRTYCQPCLSPVWDTGLAAHALLETGGAAAERAAKLGLDWLAPKQELDLAALGGVAAGGAAGGWAFRYANPHYPDLDDTAMVAMAMDRADPAAYRNAIDRAAEWLVGMQCKNGGWASFDADNEYSISTISRSPITARCSIRRPRTWRRVASACWRSWAAGSTARRSMPGWPICGGPSSRTVRGSGVGARITSTAPGRC